MARIITRELAKKIADKLEAVVTYSGGAHDLAAIYHDNILVATFGIRRASEKDKGHDYIPRKIFVGPNFAKQLGQCTKYRSDWIKELQDKGIVEKPSDPPQNNANQNPERQSS